MRVCFLTHYYPPEVGAPQTRIELLARSLAAGGATVTVHTGFPHYPDGVVRPPYRNRRWLVERRDGVTVVRSAVYPAANQGFAPRLIDHTAFAASAVATARLSGPADAVVAETPPLFTAAAGVAYAAVKRAALVVNVADRWPASAVELGALRDSRAIAAAEALERWVYRRAAVITSPTEGIADALSELPESAGRSVGVWPVVDLGRFDPRAPVGGGAGAPLEVLYAGTVGLAHGLDVLVEAAAVLGRRRVRVTIAGGGAELDRLRGLVARRRLPNVRLLGTVPAAAIPGLYADADVAAVLLRDVPIFTGALPTKMLEAMAAARPVVLSAPAGEATRFVDAAGAGLTVSPGDHRALAVALLRLRDDAALRSSLGEAGRRFAEARFGVQRAAEDWLGVLARAVVRGLNRRGLSVRRVEPGTASGHGERA